MGNLVPHFVVKHVDFLEALQVVQSGGGVGQSPHSQVVHVRHRGPVVAEGHLASWLQEFIFVLGLPVVSGHSAEISELLPTAFQVIKLVHFVNYIIIICQ